MCVAAHPDDEDGATIAYYSKIKGFKAYTVFYTRGEGGQNEIGPELYGDLGKIREKECEDAAQIVGSTPLFLGFLDFGYSKTAKETFKFWGGEDAVLARIVYYIRQIKPDVIITNHDTITIKPLRQHGNHQAVGISIFEAFEKAADPDYLPEQLTNGITPWQVKKLYFRVSDTLRFGQLVSIDINQKDTSGIVINDLAIQALSKHKTQGMDKIDWKNIPEIVKERRYELVRSDKPYPFDEKDLFSSLVPDSLPKPNVIPSSYQTVYHYPLKTSVADIQKMLEQDNNTYPHIKSADISKKLQYGLVKTYDSSIVNFFHDMNINYSYLDSIALANDSLTGYDVIIVDMRAYFYRKDVVQYNDRLMEYVNNGGNIICFYNKNFDWDAGKNYAPYPLFVTTDRVTEEDAEVAQLMNYRYFYIPYTIFPEDWNGWIQERNVYLPSDDSTKTSPKYKRLLAMQDENDPVPPTSLLVAQYGTGTYTYCALALYRQLQILNPGAVKLFLNMLFQHNTNNKKFGK